MKKLIATALIFVFLICVGVWILNQRTERFMSGYITNTDGVSYSWAAWVTTKNWRWWFTNPEIIKITGGTP